MMLINSMKMVEASASQDGLQCWVERCSHRIGAMELYFIDTLWDRVYCHQCGLCVRFRRKRALKRGEPLETVEAEP